MMTDYITLSCSSSGVKLKITPHINRFACSYCSHEHIVNRSGGTLSLSPIVDAINQVKTSVDKTTAELTNVRLPKEIENLENQEKALAPRPLRKLPKWLSSSIPIAIIVFFSMAVLPIGFFIGKMVGLLLIASGLIVIITFEIWYWHQGKKNVKEWEGTKAQSLSHRILKLLKRYRNLSLFKI